MRSLPKESGLGNLTWDLFCIKTKRFFISFILPHLPTGFLYIHRPPHQSGKKYFSLSIGLTPQCVPHPPAIMKYINSPLRSFRWHVQENNHLNNHYCWLYFLLLKNPHNLESGKEQIWEIGYEGNMIILLILLLPMTISSHHSYHHTNIIINIAIVLLLLLHLLRRIIIAIIVVSLHCFLDPVRVRRNLKAQRCWMGDQLHGGPVECPKDLSCSCQCIWSVFLKF